MEDSPTLVLSTNGGSRSHSDSTHELESPEVVVQGSILPGGNVPPETAVYALASLLVKKGLISREEIEVEIEIARLRQKAESLGATRL